MMTNKPVALPEAYAAAHTSAVLVEHAERGMLHLTGATRLDLINRMSTQAVGGLKSGEGAATVLTTDIGRIIDRVILYAGRDSVYVLTGEGHGDALARYFMRNIFFNDDVQLRDLSRETAVFGVYGARAGERLAAIGFPEVELPRHHWREAQIGGATAYLHRADGVAGDGYFVTTTVTDRAAIESALAAGLTAIDATAYDYLRIEAGLPRFGRELSLDYIPLEAGLWDDVSFSKGCYTGQEIIARMESRGKLAKRLVRLRPASPVAAGLEISAAGRAVGMVTSAADGPAGPLALGYVKTAALNDGAALSAGGIDVVVVV
ncbi:Folate-binding protein YgfZ [Candidatus Promineifilum breve]|uniref:Folate-binding protein YgfZ n=1 Tax=Candidatus Promineifilum breve TaxID=1806508 RepID=A0A160T543_9CHLR|nr:folate-binding protein YgfZ [Candidatus Promineifilum breve]CUS03945.2 Folate-binding protein YgfZ [Candidatus Promineifilum breve]